MRRFIRPSSGALVVAAVVGTILFLINQLNVVVSGNFTPLVGVKIGLTFLVPLLVSTYSALEINRLRTPQQAPTTQESSDLPRAPT